MKYPTLLALAALPACALAQTTSLPPLDLKVTAGGDTTHYHKVMHANAPQLQNVPDVPRFALLGKDGKFYMGIGANIKAVASFDAGDVISNPNFFTTSAIPVNPAPGNGGQFKFSAQQSNVYLNVVALPGTKDQIGAYVSIDFLGNGYNPQVQNAYLKWRDFQAGYNLPMFADASAMPATIDYEGPNAEATVTLGEVSWQPSFGRDNAWTAGIALDQPQYSYTNATGTSTVSQRLPDIPVYIQRNWAGGKGWLRVSGMLRNLYYRNNLAQKNVDKVGWGIQASGTTPIYGGLSASYYGLYGKGIASYIQDLNGLGMDLMPDPANPGRLEAVKAFSALGSLQYQFSPSVFCTATYSHVRTYAQKFADSHSSWNSGYKYAQYVVGNVFWNVNKIVQVGAEYIWGRRVNYDGAQGHDSRIEAMMQVSF